MAVRRTVGQSRPGAELRLEDVEGVAKALCAGVEQVVDGKSQVVRTAVTVLLAEGHLLIEDVPGVGKTMLAKGLAKTLGVGVRRIQFTPDLLPSDVTGVSVYNPETRAFEFRPGAVFSHVVVADEINRASPKTQSALLECMEERQVSVDGTTYDLEAPFLVVATQNPQDMAGTYPLPEAQRDRFMARVSMGYPSPSAELAMIDNHGTGDPLADLQPVTDVATVNALAALCRQVFVADEVRRYVVDLVGGSRTHPAVRLGASPRATLKLIRAAQTAAAMEGRDHVVPEDVASLALPVLAHRLVLGPQAGAQGQRGAEDVVTELLQTVRVGSPARRR